MSNTRPVVTVNVASDKPVKIEAVRQALSELFPDVDFQIRPCAVRLEEREGLDVNAQPEGEAQTSMYAMMRLSEMIEQYGRADLNIAIESGAIDGQDVAVIVIESARGRRAKHLLFSEAVPFPTLPNAAGEMVNTLEEARKRGFKTTTAGKIIQELRPDIPHDAWQEHFESVSGRKLTRVQQIKEALVNGSDLMFTVLKASLTAAGVPQSVFQNLQTREL